jgi:riboflavin biosynthesis pyrimidine reductase
MLLEGGSIINGAFLNAGMVDELSLVQTFLIGDKDGLPLFYNASVEGFELISCDKQTGYLYLRYKHV